MKISYLWLQDYFSETLPAPEKISEALTFHAFELESVEKVGSPSTPLGAGDTIFDIKVTPNRGHDALSHRGIAKEISAILNIPLAKDPLREKAELTPSSKELTVDIENPQLCRRYSAAVIKNITVKESPKWLQERLMALGQRPINTIVDATNLVMFDIGEPLHAFDMAHLAEKDGKRAIFVRNAAEEETIETLGGAARALTPAMLLIADGNNGKPLGIAGIKGGRAAEINEKTQTIIIEAANFSGVSIRKAAKTLSLRTDASTRFEHELSPGLTPYALAEVVELVLKIAGGELEGYVDVYPEPQETTEVSITLADANRLLGLNLKETDVEQTFSRLGFPFVKKGKAFVATPPFERLDIEIPEDLIEELGRIHGYGDVPAIVPEKTGVAEYNKIFHYADTVREALVAKGFSEIFTSSFREKGAIPMQNPFASDKGALREDLTTNIEEALARNIHHRDLLGLDAVRIFEVGAVFGKAGEQLSLCIGVRHQNQKQQKKADEEVAAATAAVAEALGAALSGVPRGGVVEVVLNDIFEKLPSPKGYEVSKETPKTRYKAFSPYPYIVRDIALWAPKDSQQEIEKLIESEGGKLLVRKDLFDIFEKEGRTSYAYRLVFQSYEKTLQDSDVVPIMKRLVDLLTQRGFEIR